MINNWFGWFREAGIYKFPALADFIGSSYSTHELDQVIKHLSIGETLPELNEDRSPCLFCGIVCNIYNEESDQVRTLTDGDWVWTDEVIHYVKYHNVKLPQEFFNSILVGKSTATPMWHEQLSKTVNYIEKLRRDSLAYADYTPEEVRRNYSVFSSACRDDLVNKVKSEAYKQLYMGNKLQCWRSMQAIQLSLGVEELNMLRVIFNELVDAGEIKLNINASRLIL